MLKGTTINANTAKIVTFSLALAVLLPIGAQQARAQAMDDGPIQKASKKPADSRLPALFPDPVAGKAAGQASLQAVRYTNSASESR